jgi:hypothetical protein
MNDNVHQMIANYMVAAQIIVEPKTDVGHRTGGKSPQRAAPVSKATKTAVFGLAQASALSV